MKDKTNNYWINHLWKGQNNNILFQFLVNEFEDDTEHSYDLNIKEYVSYENTMKQRDNIDEEEEVEIDCDVEINNVLPYYNNITWHFPEINDTFDLASCH